MDFFLTHCRLDMYDTRNHFNGLLYTLQMFETWYGKEGQMQNTNQEEDIKPRV